MTCLLALLLGWMGPAGSPALAETPSGDNAALHYWRAAALLRSPRNASELAIDRFIREELPPMPPGIFAARPRVGRWLLEDRAAVEAMMDAAALARCDFHPRQRRRLTPSVDHLPVLRGLTDRALEVAKAYSYVENEAGAAGIYVALLGLAEHLDQDQSSLSTVFGYELIERVLLALESYFTRNPPPEATVRLTRYFADAPRPVFSLDEHLRARAQRDIAWMLSDSSRLLERLRGLYGNARHQPAVDYLLTLDGAQREERLRGWLEQYENMMERMAAACAKPYQTGLNQVRKLDAEVAAHRGSREKTGESPLVPLLVPRVGPLYERLLLGEAHFAMADILCAAALYRAELKAWPKRLVDAERFVGRSFRPDPFTGEPVHYTLRKGGPVIGVRAPKWLARRERLTFQVDVGERFEEDQGRVTRYVKEMELQARRERLAEQATEANGASD